MKKILITGFLAVTLCACGGGGGGTIAENAPVGEQDGIASSIARFDDLNQGFVNVSSDAPLQTDLPGAGLVNYSGDIGFDVRGALPGGGSAVDASFVGDMNVTVNFGGTNQPVAGSANNFLYADSNGNFDSVDGTLNISGIVTDLQRDNLPDLPSVIAADMTGNLAFDQGDGNGNKTVNFDLNLSGQFGGVPNATSATAPIAMRGFVTGTGSGSGLSLVAPNGRFAAQSPGTNLLP